VRPTPPKRLARATPARRLVERPDAEPAGDATAAMPGVSDAQLAGAATAGGGDAGSGAGGGACNMIRRVQEALRRDPLVRSTVARSIASGRAILVWDGDWVQSPGEDGKGLSAVREAIMWEVAFAPKACRAEAVRGLVLFSLGAGQARLVVGAGAWRWSDLLTPRRQD
jgi:hypothetical protein